MKLSTKSLKRLIKGAVYFTEDKGYLSCFRYSREQIEYMAQESYDYGWRLRAMFSGGIRIELKTEADRISFEYKASGSCDRSNTIDLYENGVLKQVYKIGDKLKGKVEFMLTEGKKRVFVYLPCESRLDIKNFTVNGKYESVKSNGKRLLIIGDSITQGAGPEISSSAYINVLSRKTGYNILGQGVGGYRYEPGDLMKIDGFEPEKIIVFLGTNYYEEDCLTKCNYDYKRAVEDFYVRITELYPQAPILSITPLWRNNDVDWDRFNWCIDTIKGVCEKYENVRVVDGLDLVPNVDECFSDKVHPNAYGSYLLCENLIKYMKEIGF
ncbi:MAG: SGNH/GDSL hydrolase family protein [Clostridia bacterium]|nr:SGNH/GDSL hydrolase family protein [Clostridia bacterium]